MLSIIIRMISTCIPDVLLSNIVIYKNTHVHRNVYYLNLYDASIIKGYTLILISLALYIYNTQAAALTEQRQQLINSVQIYIILAFFRNDFHNE